MCMIKSIKIVENYYIQYTVVLRCNGSMYQSLQWSLPKKQVVYIATVVKYYGKWWISSILLNVLSIGTAAR